MNKPGVAEFIGFIYLVPFLFTEHRETIHLGTFIFLLFALPNCTQSEILALKCLLHTKNTKYVRPCKSPKPCKF